MSGKQVLIVITMVIVCSSCNDEPSLLGAAFRSDDVSYGVAFVDTTTVTTSTVLIDSLPTSWSGTMLAGKYTDNIFGKIESTAYIQFGTESGWSADANAVFDSAVLLLPYSGFWYGDTTAMSTLAAHQVNETFTTYSLPLYWTDEGNYPYFNATSGLFNTSDFRTDPTILGSKTFKPRPNSIDTVRIRLSDYLGTTWLEEAKNETNYFISGYEFQKYFQGIAIKEISSAGASMFGINASGARIRVYYREYADEVLQPKFADLTYNSLYYQYNKITADRSNTALASLQETNKQLYSTSTDNETYIQSGVGILTKVEFPYIKQFNTISGLLIINNALLVIEPVHTTYDSKNQLPATLTLFQTNETNVPLAPLYTDYSSSDQFASITIDDEFGKTSGYTFSITQYVQSLVTNTYTGTPALFISTPLSELRSSVTRACLGGGKHPDYKMRLEIYYTFKK